MLGSSIRDVILLPITTVPVRRRVTAHLTTQHRMLLYGGIVTESGRFDCGQRGDADGDSTFARYRRRRRGWIRCHSRDSGRLNGGFIVEQGNGLWNGMIRTHSSHIVLMIATSDVREGQPIGPDTNVVRQVGHVDLGGVGVR